MESHFWSRFLRFWFPLLAYSGIIFYASAQPGSKTPQFLGDFDKIAHVCEYVPFGYLIARAIFDLRRGWSGGLIVVISMIIGFVYGLSDEFHQSFVPGREASFADLIADVAGATLGACFYLRRK